VTGDASKSQPPQDPASPPSRPAKPQGEANMPRIVQSRTTRTTVADKWVFVTEAKGGNHAG
jgi:hypothetical protein